MIHKVRFSGFYQLFREDHSGARVPAKIEPMLIFQITKMKILGGINLLYHANTSINIIKTRCTTSTMNTHVQLVFRYEDKYNWDESMQIETIRI